jgi:hypothetical protein
VIAWNGANRGPARTDFVTLSPSDPAGLIGVGDVLIAPDGALDIYRSCRQLSQLVVVNFAGRQRRAVQVRPHP